MYLIDVLFAVTCTCLCDAVLVRQVGSAFSLKYKRWSANAARNHIAVIMIFTSEATDVNNYKITHIVLKNLAVFLSPYTFSSHKLSIWLRYCSISFLLLLCAFQTHWLSTIKKGKNKCQKRNPSKNSNIPITVLCNFLTLQEPNYLDIEVGVPSYFFNASSASWIWISFPKHSPI